MNWSEDEEELLQKLRSLGTQGYPRQGYAEKLRNRLHQEMKRKQSRKRNLQKVMVTGVTAASLFLTVQMLTTLPLSTPNEVIEQGMTLLEEKHSLMAELPSSPPSRE